MGLSVSGLGHIFLASVALLSPVDSDSEHPFDTWLISPAQHCPEPSAADALRLAVSKPSTASISNVVLGEVVSVCIRGIAEQYAHLLVRVLSVSRDRLLPALPRA